MSNEEEKMLNRKRGSLKQRLTLFKSYVESINSKINELKSIVEVDREIIIELEVRLEKCQSLLQDFEEVQELIDGLHDDLTGQTVERQSFENIFYKITALSKKIISDYYKSVAVSEKVDQSVIFELPNNDSINLSQGIKLPQITLPTFSGEYNNWMEFRDTFVSLIHSNKSIGNIQKFHYLRASLAGSALNIINSLEFSASNYDIAWELIRNRYNNTRLLIHNHVGSLFSLPTLQHETSSGLRQMIDTMTKHLRCLNSLGQKTEHWDILMIFIMCTKLDKVTAREWEEFKATQEVPTLTEFNSFIKNRSDMLETLGAGKKDKLNQNSKSNKPGNNFMSSNLSCYFCKAGHYIHNCGNFLKLSVSARIDEAKKLRLCLNCLRANHSTKDCRSVSCQKCGGRHNSLLHIEKRVESVTTSENRHNVVSGECSSSNTTLTSFTSNKCVLLSTALVQVPDSSGYLHTCRVLLDSGSESCYITGELCKKLNLEQSRVDLSVVGINQMVTNLSSRCTVEFISRFNSFQTSISCFVIPKICDNIPSSQCDFSSFQIPKNIKLADPDFYKPHTIDILLGANIFWHLLCIGQINLGKNQPILQKTKLGWIISGPISSQSISSQVRCNMNKQLDVQTQLTKFWELEESTSSKPVLSKEEQLCESIFVNTTRRDQDGRFIVVIPLKEEVSRLGDSKQMALNKFYSLENRLRKNPILRDMYIKFMEEYESLGHMSKVSENNDGHISFYFPHHGVLNEHSLTTKLRVVFNGSAPSDSGWSLNDLQLVGPTIQEDLMSIILRFRTHPIVVGADISKMYRQILIDPSQRCLQKILWRTDSNAKVETYTLNTVTYGTASAPYLAIRCLHQLALDHVETHPHASRVISNDFYVDDMVSGAQNVNDAISMCKDVGAILNTAGLKLHKWSSNSPEVLEHMNISKSSTNVIQFGEREGTKTLGLFWSSTLDVLMYNINVNIDRKSISKRSILSDIAHIFDPLGLLSPCIIIAKIMLQKLWTYKLSWDESLPSELHNQWQYFKNQLPFLNNIQITRNVLCNHPVRTELHGFSDGSQDAYAAVVYVRTIDSNGCIYVRLFCSRSKVAPLKSITIPRLELCGAVILSQLINKVKESSNLKFDSVYLWTDSTIVLCWIRTEPNLLQTFVSNRVAQIQTLTDRDTWRHVRGDENPADLASRGIYPNKLREFNVWWHGPSWLLSPEEMWENSCPELTCENVPETRKQVKSFLANDLSPFPFERFSKFSRAIRSTAYCLRFINNSKSSTKKLTGPLTVGELNNAETCLVKISQKECFSKEISDLKKSSRISNKSHILNLNPFLDTNGILRVGGRLSNSQYPYEKIHPKIVSSKHQYTKLLFSFEHIRLCHAGPQMLLSSIKERYWPISGRNLAKKVCHDCIRCYKVNPKISNPIMGALPGLRSRPQSVFYATGVDYAGPFTIKDRRGRGSKTSKCYIAVFICFSTKALHLELVSDLSTDAFILAFRRFISRRGKPRHIFSDNGKNFVGAAADLKDLGKFLLTANTSLTETVAADGIDWQFIPAYSPHFGGLWEAGVKSVKYHMKRVLGNVVLTFEQMYTFLTQIEAILNSRPLTPISTDPNDLDVLTPGHFLIGKRITALPDEDLLSIPANRLNEYQQIQQLMQHLWSRWSKEYISELQQRIKWKTQGSNLLKPGVLVILKEDNTPPLHWKMGRIVSVHKGSDGVARVATVKTQAGVFKRSFSKLCIVPIETDNNLNSDT